MQFQEWLRPLCLRAGLEASESEDLWALLPSFPFSLSTSSLLGLGALASLTVYWLVTRPQPMRPPCDLQAQSVAVGVSAPPSTAAFECLDVPRVFSLQRGFLFVCREIRAAGGPLCFKMTLWWSFTTTTSGRCTTCSREVWGSQVTCFYCFNTVWKWIHRFKMNPNERTLGTTYQTRILLSPPGHGPCLGFRKPGQPYEWISYVEVWQMIPQSWCLCCAIRFSWLSMSDLPGDPAGTVDGQWPDC